MSILDILLIVTALTAALWWAVSRHRRPAVLEALSFAAAFSAVLRLLVEGMRWQLVPWQVLHSGRGGGRLRRWRPGHSRRWRRAIARGAARRRARRRRRGSPHGVRARRCPSRPVRIGAAARSSAGLIPARGDADARTRRTTGRSSRRRGTRATRARDVQFRTSRRRAACPARSAACRPFMFGSFGGVDDPRHGRCSDQRRPEDLAGAAVLARSVAPARDVLGALR